MKVKCIKNYGTGGVLKKNKVYEVLSESCDCYQLRDVEGWWGTERFKIVTK